MGAQVVEGEFHCPHCGERAPTRMEDRTQYACPRCRRRYRVLVDAEADDVALFEQAAAAGVPPLGLPRGSIRAAVALAMLATAVLLAVVRGTVPASLLSLLLAVLGFYWGFRTKAAALSDRVYDPAARRDQPLHLPGGAIRRLLVAGVLLMGMVLLGRGGLNDNQALEFFVVMAGLIAGHFFARLIGRINEPGLRAAVEHVKGAAALLMAAVVALLFLTGADRSLHPITMGLLCATISFYFGSRS